MKSLKKMHDPFIDIYPSIDLHGYDRVYAVMKTREFVEENYALNNKKMVVIHGIGEGILRREIHLYLSKEKKVISFKLDNNNLGVTIVEIR